MKKYLIIFAYWWCIMYPSFGLNLPYISGDFVLENQDYEFKFKIVEYISEFCEMPFSVNFS